MSNNYVDWRKQQNIKTTNLPNKEQYYIDLMHIEHSWTGRIDANLCNTFIMEAEQQLINAMELFEMGYFDCAYYSLRSAVDVSTTMVFLSDLPEEERERYLAAWKATDDFPIQGRIVRQLIDYGYIFSDMYEKMPEFFSDAKDLSAALNKYVHKQGLRHFYISRNHPMNQNKSQEAFISDFQYYLEKCIGVVAVMRLAIDPFPVLLMDDEILYRCFDSMTEPYSKDFVEKYIGLSVIEQYKQTDLYAGTYASFIAEEKKNEAVFNVMKYEYIDTKRIDEINSQLHLLSKDDVIAVKIISACDRITKVYCSFGLMIFSSDRKTNRSAHSWCTEDFDKFSKSDQLMNQPYDEVYISVFIFEDEFFFAEHNELLDDSNIMTINENVFNTISNKKPDLTTSN